MSRTADVRQSIIIEVLKMNNKSKTEKRSEGGEMHAPFTR